MGNPWRIRARVGHSGAAATLNAERSSIAAVMTSLADLISRMLDHEAIIMPLMRSRS